MANQGRRRKWPTKAEGKKPDEDGGRADRGFFVFVGHFRLRPSSVIGQAGDRPDRASVIGHQRFLIPAASARYTCPVVLRDGCPD
jgi:hypothetical protein